MWVNIRGVLPPKACRREEPCTSASAGVLGVAPKTAPAGGGLRQGPGKETMTGLRHSRTQKMQASQ